MILFLNICLSIIEKRNILRCVEVIYYYLEPSKFRERNCNLKGFLMKALSKKNESVAFVVSVSKYCRSFDNHKYLKEIGIRLLINVHPIYTWYFFYTHIYRLKSQHSPTVPLIDRLPHFFVSVFL